MTTTPVASDSERPVDQPPTKDPPAKAPSAKDKNKTPALAPPLPPRLLWRVVVRTGGSGKMDPSRPSRPLAWHMATCTDSELPEAHCPEGRRLLASGDDPDGHCLLNGICPRDEAQK
jgi:hypothetical protein